MAMQRLKEAAEKAKIELSTATTTDVNLPFIPIIHFSQNIETTGAKIVSQIRNGRKWKYQFAWNQAELSLIVWIDKVKGSILNNQIRLIHQFFKSLNVDSSPSNRHQFS